MFIKDYQNPIWMCSMCLLVTARNHVRISKLHQKVAKNGPSKWTAAAPCGPWRIPSICAWQGSWPCWPQVLHPRMRRRSWDFWDGTVRLAQMSGSFYGFFLLSSVFCLHPRWNVGPWGLTSVGAPVGAPLSPFMNRRGLCTKRLAEDKPPRSLYRSMWLTLTFHDLKEEALLRLLIH